MRELWGKNVNNEIPDDVFPSAKIIAEFDETFHHPEHGFLLSTHDGKKLHYRRYLPQNGSKPKAIVVWQHGIHGSSGYGMKRSDGLYTNVALRARLCDEAGIALYCQDQLGHGFSEGRRFLIPGGDWTINRDDLANFAKFAASMHDDGTPLFVSGDSYGACLAIHVGRYLQDHPDEAPKGFRGLALNSPAIVGDLPPAPVVFLLQYCLAPFFPAWTPFFMPHPVSAERIWKDEEARAYHSDDDQSYGLSRGGKPFCLGTAVGLLKALEAVREIIPGLTVPFCINHGDEDLGVPLAGSEYMMMHAKTDKKDKTLNVVKGGYHDLYSGADAKELMSEQIEWILSRCR